MPCSAELACCSTPTFRSTRWFQSRSTFAAPSTARRAVPSRTSPPPSISRAPHAGADCKLHTTREELVLSFVPGSTTRRIRWDRKTIDNALHAGLDRAAHEVAGNGIAGSVLAITLGKVVAPAVEWFLQHAR